MDEKRFYLTITTIVGIVAIIGMVIMFSGKEKSAYEDDFAGQAFQASFDIGSVLTVKPSDAVSDTKSYDEEYPDRYISKTYEYSSEGWSPEQPPVQFMFNDKATEFVDKGGIITIPMVWDAEYFELNNIASSNKITGNQVASFKKNIPDLSGAIYITPYPLTSPTPPGSVTTFMKPCQDHVTWIEIAVGGEDVDQPFFVFEKNSIGFGVGTIYDPLQTITGYFPANQIIPMWFGLNFRYGIPTKDTIEGAIDHTFNRQPVNYSGIMVPDNNIREGDETNNYLRLKFQVLGNACVYPWSVGESAAYDTTYGWPYVQETLSFDLFNPATDTAYFTDSVGAQWTAWIPPIPFQLHKDALITTQIWDGASLEVGAAYKLDNNGTILFLNPDLDGNRIYGKTRVVSGVHVEEVYS